MNSNDLKTISVAIPRPLNQLYTYLLPEDLANDVQVGKWVKVPFGRATTHGYIVGEPKGIDEIDQSIPRKALKNILSVSEPSDQINQEIYDLCQFVSKYYHCPLGEVLNAAASPAAMGHGVQKPAKQREDSLIHVPVQLTEAQKKSYQDIQSHSQTVSLLQGVTGSGKTEVYIELGRKVLLEGKGLIILVPEIALTHQLHQRFEKGLGFEVGLWHSALSTAKRKKLWLDLNQGKLKCVIGARSAVFAPIQNLGMVVIDEEHDATFKQEDRARYHARDVAIYRAVKNGAKVVLGSATPCLETLEKVDAGKFGITKLEKRFSNRPLPEIQTVDLTEDDVINGTQSIWSKTTIDEIQRTIDRKEQVMIFMNRRGFANFMICEDCGEVIECPNCSISLTVHKKRNHLRCHLCDHKQAMPHTCTKCEGTNLKAIGSGTEGLEKDIEALVTGARIQRLDRDQITSTKKLESVIQNFARGETNIMIGTQMLTKGHDFSNVTLVVVAFADGLFRWPDFRANERALQTLIQVSGRAGRGDKLGRVLIQTYQPDHLVIETLKNNISMDEFMTDEKELRKECHYPPFSRIARIRVEHRDSKKAHQQILALSEIANLPSLEVLGPSEAFISRVKGIYRWDLLLKAKDVQSIQVALSQIEEIASHHQFFPIIDVDPMSMG